MNDHERLTALLEEEAMQSIPETVNLWPGIRRSIHGKTARSALLRRRGALTLAAALFAAILLGGLLLAMASGGRDPQQMTGLLQQASATPTISATATPMPASPAAEAAGIPPLYGLHALSLDDGPQTLVFSQQQTDYLLSFTVPARVRYGLEFTPAIPVPLVLRLLYAETSAMPLNESLGLRPDAQVNRVTPSERGTYTFMPDVSAVASGRVYVWVSAGEFAYTAENSATVQVALIRAGSIATSPLLDMTAIRSDARLGDDLEAYAYLPVTAAQTQVPLDARAQALLVSPGLDVSFYFYWRLLNPVDRDYQVVAALVPDDAAQDPVIYPEPFALSAMGSPVSEWHVDMITYGEPLNLALPDDLPLGDYTLRWIRVDAGAPLPEPVALLAGTDYVALRLRVGSAAAAVAATPVIADDISELLPPGTVAVSLPLRGVSVPRELQAGDSVDVIASFLYVNVDDAFQIAAPNAVSASEVEMGALMENAPDIVTTIQPPAGDGTVPRLLTQRVVVGVQVLTIGDFAQGPQEIGTADIITLAVSPQDAVVLQWMIDADIPLTLVFPLGGE